MNAVLRRLCSLISLIIKVAVLGCQSVLKTLRSRQVIDLQDIFRMPIAARRQACRPALSPDGLVGANDWSQCALLSCCGTRRHPVERKERSEQLYKQSRYRMSHPKSRNGLGGTDDRPALDGADDEPSSDSSGRVRFAVLTRRNIRPRSAPLRSRLRRRDVTDAPTRIASARGPDCEVLCLLPRSSLPPRLAQDSEAGPGLELSAFYPVAKAASALVGVRS
jgi:hypothetical protein